MPIPIFSYDWYRLKTDTDISINTDMVLADTDMIKTDTDISVSVSAKNIDQRIYRSISNYLSNEFLYFLYWKSIEADHI